MAWGFSPLSAWAGVCLDDQRITDPEPLAWTHHPADAANPEPHWSATLEIGEQTLVIGGETLTTRVYRVPGSTGTIPAPTMILHPGRKYVLRFRNVLPYEEPSHEHNVFKDPNVSNLHTHGVHISGETPGDDVTRSFEGGAAGDFVYDIPADHMGGTYWYHAHHHGSTYLQVSAGAFGLLVIDDAQDPMPANVAAMEERHLVVAYLDPAAAGTGGDTLLSGTLNPTWTVNGRVHGDLCVPPDTWQHWRILVADRDARPRDVTIGEGCEAMLLARDGVWRNETPAVLEGNRVRLSGASRADLAVRCSADSELRVGARRVAGVVVDGPPGGDGHPFAEDGYSTWRSARPAYLQDLRGLPVDGRVTVEMGFRTINGRRFNHDVPNFTATPSGVQEWTLQGAHEHPFHLHIYHVQVVGECPGHEDGEYYDVVSGDCTIRFDLDAQRSSVYSGRTILHCHILPHGDQGAMGWLDVLGGEGALGAPRFPEGFGYVAYEPSPQGRSTPLAPANLEAFAPDPRQVMLRWQDLADDETGFDIERSFDGLNFLYLDSVGADVTAYADLAAGRLPARWYRVRAFNEHGPSGYSEVVLVEMPDPPADSRAPPSRLDSPERR
ncbi:MAG: multicopper oxidase domain-containing protein [Xanthomonadales bacterium]|nr:multicopper oxidase domain-containing protein [Xanthomonadales bacterium]